MTDQLILCPIRDDKHPYAYCYDGKGERSKTLRISYDPQKEITSLQCMTKPKEHRFKVDREGNVIKEK